MSMESTAEQYLNDEIVKLGGMTYKFVSPSRKFVPDRIVMCWGKCIFVEMKAVGEKPNSGQIREIDKINTQFISNPNVSATWVCGKVGVDEFIKREFRL